MNKTEVVELIKFINGAYPRFTINENTPSTWYEMIQHQTFEKTMERLKSHILTSKFEPTISDLFITPDLSKEELLQRWVNEGNDPSEFVYRPTT